MFARAPRKPVRVRILVLLWLAASGLQEPSPPPQTEAEQIVDRARSLQRLYREREALRLYLEALKASPSHFEAICGASYLYGQVGKRLSSQQEQREYYEKALLLAQQAFAARPQDPEANLVMAWAHGGIALISGFRKKIAAGRKVKEHVDRTLQSRPEDHRAWYILANLNYQVGTAGFFQKRLVMVLFGGLPEELSLEHAIAAYRKAVEIRPDFILYRYELARTLHRLDRPGEAADQLRQALNLDPRFEDDLAVLKQCRQLLSRVE